MTHEQADFDAVASILGAYLISSKTYAIKPRLMNRNVGLFINKFKEDLPFTPFEDLPVQLIESILLVDAQSIATIKGTNSSTHFFVIDHHRHKKPLPEGWTHIETQTGACTTYFVEKIKKSHIKMSMIEATMMLLGIYEDTGSITYADTTSRDVQAAAYLLDQGASLKVAAEYLNPPLSEAQSQLLDDLVKNVQTLTIHGLNILVSHASAKNLKEEISSVAHKMVDLLNPNALFIFVLTHEGIRLVARSLTDQVNVAQITAEFGGGGHSRAAAALIHTDTIIRKNTNIGEFVKDFINELPMSILPSVTVEQIMSKKPLLINPDTLAREAIELMQQFGYEGYPVVKNNKVIGLLTRRAVDRALSHKMNLPAISLMEAGSVSVKTSDSLELLQNIMANSGWGQVPVIDSSSGEITGIVTRTDLLITLAGGNGNKDRVNLTREMNKQLAPSMVGLIKMVAEQAAKLNFPIFIVGGFVRDLLLKQPSPDVDFVIEGDAITLGKSFLAKFGGKLVSHSKFGTCKWHLENAKDVIATYTPSGCKFDSSALPKSIDLISARTEYYSYPTALPTVKSGSIKLDLQRRDFTINTLAIRLDGNHYGELYDYWGGLSDLQKKQIRVLHSLSFVDDPTRILRAIRFQKQLLFSIESRTLHLLHEAKSLLEKISGDRIRHELDLVFSSGVSSSIMEEFQKLGLLSIIYPSLGWKTTLNKQMDFITQQIPPKEWHLPSEIGTISIQRFLSYLLLLSNLKKEDVHKVGKRLHLSAQLVSMIVRLNEVHNCLLKHVSAKPSQIIQLLEDVHIVILYALHELTENDMVRKNIHDFVFKWNKLKPYTDGKTLHKLKIPPGPIYKNILSGLKDAWVDGVICNREEEKLLLEKYLTEYQSEKNGSSPATKHKK